MPGIPRGGGVSVYVRNVFISKPLNRMTFIDNFIETNCVRIEIAKDTFLDILGVYRPPSNDSLSDFLEHFLDKISPQVMKHNVCILGDMNTDLLRELRQLHEVYVFCFSY